MPPQGELQSDLSDLGCACRLHAWGLDIVCITQLCSSKLDPDNRCRAVKTDMSACLLWLK